MSSGVSFQHKTTLYRDNPLKRTEMSFRRSGELSEELSLLISTHTNMTSDLDFFYFFVEAICIAFNKSSIMCLWCPDEPLMLADCGASHVWSFVHMVWCILICLCFQKQWDGETKACVKSQIP